MYYIIIYNVILYYNTLYIICSQNLGNKNVVEYKKLNRNEYAAFEGWV